MTRAALASTRLETRQTAVTEKVTGTFHCSSSNHWVTGTPLMFRGRKICRACVEKRKQTLKKKAHD